MNLNQLLPLSKAIGVLMALVCLAAPSAHGNIYATNVRLNGGTNNLTLPAGGSVAISYILNEPASLGLTVNILSGSSVLRQIILPPLANGTARGTNTVIWDGRDANSNPAAAGTYSISITAASSGFTNWTQISSDDDTGAYAFDPQAIAVERDPASPWYGRVFIANSSSNPFTNSPTGGDLNGILKFNADASAADEGVSSGGTDGHAWSGNANSPWKLEVSDEGFLYVDDLSHGGEVFRWDPLVSSNSLLSVLRSDNRPSTANLGGLAVLGSGTNTQIWMTDVKSGGGILRWLAGPDGTCANGDLGLTVVGVNPDADLQFSPPDVAVDTNGNIYTCQAITESGNAAQRVMRFPAYDPSTNGNAPEFTANWAVGTTNDSFTGASGLAVDPSGQYLAVAFQGMLAPDFSPINGNTKILSTSNGAVVAELDLGVEMNGEIRHQDTDCAWDAVGNVYYLDWYQARWRVVSPPGTNQSTTLALATVTVQGSTTLPAPVITGLSVSGNMVTIEFTGTAADVPGSFEVRGATSASGPYPVMPGAVITQVSPGVFRATLSAAGAAQFFLIARTNVQPPPPESPLITSLSVASGVTTITFTGVSTDTAASFSLLAAPTPAGGFVAAPGAAISQLGPGLFQATAPASAPMTFYRILHKP